MSTKTQLYHILLHGSQYLYLYQWPTSRHLRLNSKHLSTALPVVRSNVLRTIPLSIPATDQLSAAPKDALSTLSHALDELAHAIDSLLADIRETDSLLYRAVYRPAAAENGRQWYERESLREQAGGLQRSLQRAAAEAWAMQEALRRRKMPNDDSDKDRVTIQKGKKRVTLVEPERE
ncbi:MAG: hypothetical protein STHCBS139747_006571 [Sporothrix thermara]